MMILKIKIIVKMMILKIKIIGKSYDFGKTNQIIAKKMILKTILNFFQIIFNFQIIYNFSNHF